MDKKITNKLYKIICLLCICAAFLVIFGDTVAAAEPEACINTEGEINADEAALFELINAARVNPLEMAESLGMDRDQILADFPDLEEILKDGLPSLQIDKRLNQSAGKHALDMMENGYYAYDSIDGKTYEKRMICEGYIPFASGESLGLIFFNNFIGPDQGVRQIFDNMFRDELNPELNVAQNILNPDVSEVGLGITGGMFTHSSGFSANVYMAVCDFARPVEIYELELLNLVNQLRAEARAVLAEYGIDASPEAYPEYETLLTKGLPPLAHDHSLYASAEELAVDMFENHHFNAKTSDGRTLEDRVAGNGYEPVWVGETRYRVSTCDESVSPAESVSKMFRYLLNRAFQADPERRHYPMLSPWARDCGIRIMAGESAILGGVCGDYLHIMVAEFGAGHETGGSVDFEDVSGAGDDTTYMYGQLAGVVYEDRDANGLYDIGEGVSGIAVTAVNGKDTEAVYGARSNAAGGYSLDLPRGRYRVDVETESGVYSKWLDISEETAHWLPVDVEIPVKNQEE